LSVSWNLKPSRRISELEKQIKACRSDLATISDALRIFGEPSKYAREDRLFDRGERARIIFDTLREAPDGLDTKELAVIVMKAKGLDLDETELSDLRRLICRGMQRFRTKGRVRQGEMRDGPRNLPKFFSCS
jgi:hypothetical protein